MNVKSMLTYFVLIVLVFGCTNSTRDLKYNFKEKPIFVDDFKWLKRPPNIEVSYQTGYTEDGLVIVPGGFYLTTDYTKEEIQSFWAQIDSICGYLQDPLTRTNCVLLLNELYLVDNLDKQESSYQDWDENFAIEQISMWKRKFGCQ